MTECKSGSAKYALVFFMGHGNTAVVPFTSLRGDELQNGQMCETRWEKDTWYRTKIVELGNNKLKLSKIVVDRNGNKWDDKQGPLSTESQALKKNIQADRRNENINARASGKDVELDLCEETPFDFSSAESTSGSQDASTPVVNSSLQNDKAQTDCDLNAGSSDTISQGDLNASNSALNSAGAGSSDSLVEAACQYFKHAIVPIVTPPVVVFVEKLLTCMKMLQNSPFDETEDYTIYPCDHPGKGRVELIPGSGVWISRKVRDVIVARTTGARADAQEMLRKLLIATLGEENLRNFNASGKARSGHKPIPERILNPVKTFVGSHFTASPDILKKFTKTINNLCGNYRRKEKPSSAEANSESNGSNKRPKISESVRSPPRRENSQRYEVSENTRILRSSPNKKLLIGIHKSPSPPPVPSSTKSKDLSSEKVEQSSKNSRSAKEADLSVGTFDAIAAARRAIDFGDQTETCIQSSQAPAPAPPHPVQDQGASSVQAGYVFPPPPYPFQPNPYHFPNYPYPPFQTFQDYSRPPFIPPYGESS